MLDILFLYGAIPLAGLIALFVFMRRILRESRQAQEVARRAQADLAQRLIEKEVLEEQMAAYTDRLEESRFAVMTANAKLKEEESKIRTIMDNVKEGVITINEQGVMQMFNQAAERIFGYSALEAIGKNVSMLMPEPYRHLGTDRELTGLRKDGSRFPMVLSASEVRIGKAPLFIGLVRDITLQKEKEEDLRHTKERAEAASKTKSEFLANMSHELRTPLNSILGMTRIMLESHLPPQQQEQARVVMMSSINLLDIVNDILDLSKIEAGEMRIENIGFDLSYLLDSIVQTLTPMATEKRLTIIKKYDAAMPYLLGDPTRLGRILTNLMGNAIKYTDAGHVELRALMRPLDKGHIELRCEIADTGIGIPWDKLESVFQKFVQADTSTARRYGGTGLGLAITRELVTLMGGDIGVKSEVGVGSVFWFTISFEVTDRLHENTDIRRRKMRVGTLSPQQARILVAEDHLMNQLLIKQLMPKFGIGTFKIAADGVEAVNLFKTETWDVVLMDCHMPNKTGYEAALEIRALEKTGTSSDAHVPIVAMTADAMLGNREKCLAAGMDEYISKPIDADELKDVLGQWLRLEKTGDEDAPGATGGDLVDLTSLRNLLGGNVEIEKELIAAFAKQSNDNLSTLEETRDADGENKQWSDAAHMLKGGAGSLGAENLRLLCNKAQNFTGAPDQRAALYALIADEYARVIDHLKRSGLLS